MLRASIARLLHQLTADQQGQVATRWHHLFVLAAVSGATLAASPAVEAALTNVTSSMSGYVSSHDAATQRFAANCECDCKIIRLVDVCGKDDPSCCRDEDYRDQFED